MKSLRFFSSFALLFFLGFATIAQNNEEERLNLPGDNLNLYGVMKLFQESETLEGFERNLNAEDSKINNLDLNGDDKIDYIRVIDNVHGNDHTIVLQVAVNERENQDVAVFTVQKDAANQVEIQLIGDEELYGKNYIIEPNYSDQTGAGETPNPGYTGQTSVQGEPVTITRTTYVEVASWPVIAYMFMPSYTIWHSPWYWGYYPSYWNPWRPYYWDYYYGYHSHWHHYYYGHYRPWHHYRYAHWNDHYYSHNRSYSNTVYQRRESGSYRNTYSRPDQRKAGSEAYTRRYSDNNTRNAGRTGATEGVKRQGENSGVNRGVPSGRGEGKPAVRQSKPSQQKREGVNNQHTRPDVNKPSGRNIENKPATRNSGSKKVERSNGNRSEIKSGDNRSTPRQSKSNPSSGSKKSGRSGESKSPRR